MQCSRSLSALAVLLLATSAALLAQTTESTSDQVAHIGSPRSNYVPYTCNRTTTIVQTLADGTHITRTFTVKEARDSKGRTYSELHQTFHVGADGRQVDLVTYSMSDPVAGKVVHWHSNSKIASVTHETLLPAQVPDPDAARQPRVSLPTQHKASEGLGVRTIAGIEARGTRFTSIIPAGDVGNDQPLTIVTENWISTQYNIPLLTITDDPRMGKRTDEVTEFQAGEPDPALFQIPKGYTVREHSVF